MLIIPASKTVVNNMDGGTTFFSDQQITDNVSKKSHNKLLSIQHSTVTPQM